MKTTTIKCRILFSCATILLIISSSIQPFASAKQAPAASEQAKSFEPAITRVRELVTLNDEQVAKLRSVFAKHAQKLAQLKSRAAAQPYSPQVETDISAEQTAMRDEFAADLSEEQKPRLIATDLRVVPQPPGFIFVDIPPRADSKTSPGVERAITPPAQGSKAGASQLAGDQKILQLLNRATFGPRPGDIDRVKQMGVPNYLEQQLHPERIDNSNLEKRLSALSTVQMTNAELYSFYPQPNVAMDRLKQKDNTPVYGRPQQIMIELLQQRLVRAVDSVSQLQEVMTDFWFNHFNIFLNKDADLYMTTSYERDVIRPNALGKFQDLLLAVAESPAMLYYLDNWVSVYPDGKRPGPPPIKPGPKPAAAPGKPAAVPAKPAPQPGPKPAAAPAKPNVAIATVANRPGVRSGQLQTANAPGTLKPAAATAQKPAAAAPAPAKPAPPKPASGPGINENYAREIMELHTLGVDGGYTQHDVQEVARCFTGWTIDRPGLTANFVFRPWTHDPGTKIVLGTNIPAGGGISDGQRVIELLAHHPSTAHFVSKKLCQRFVSDNPPARLVDRIAKVFLKTDGDIREVVRAILTSPEFNSAAAFRSKVKSPLELAASAIRAVDGDTNGSPAMQDWIRRTGEPLYQYQFPTGYGEDSSRWVNTGVFLNRLNFLVALAVNQVNGTHYDPMKLAGAQALANQDALKDRLVALVLHTTLSPESQRALSAGLGSQPEGKGTGAVRAIPVSAKAPGGPSGSNGKPAAQAGTDPNAAGRTISQIVGLLFGTAEFQRK